MTHTQLDRARQLAEQARNLPPERRERLLELECGSDAELAGAVRDMLSGTAAGTPLEKATRGADPGPMRTAREAATERAEPETRAAAGVAEPAPRVATPGVLSGLTPDFSGRTVGSCVLRSQIGQGGMGSVYLAEQSHPRRQVAVKLIRPGAASARQLRRFEFEADVLGRLEHANIARIYEAGYADLGAGPQPYFVMELVSGVPLTQHAQGARRDAPPASPLSTRQRLELFAQVADAVHHAHQKGVIHRDLKPANILVTDAAQAKVLDFGVARTVDAECRMTTLETDVGQLVGTLQYMSPEQVSGDPAQVDTRSDIYALGVVLYELLTGRLPYVMSNPLVPMIVRIIREEEPTRLSRIDRSLRGDVETIVEKTLDKDKQRRYASASDLAEDIRRYLRHEPILARPASAVYQFRKFARRNKALVAGVSAVFAAIVLGMIGTLIGLSRAVAAEKLAGAAAFRAEQQQLKAEQATEKALSANAELTGALQEVSAVTLRLALERGDWSTAMRQVEEALRNGWGDPIELRLTRVRCLDALQRYDDAVAECEALLDEVGSDGPHTGAVRLWLGELLMMDPIRNSDGNELIAEALTYELSEADRSYAEALAADSMPVLIAKLERTLAVDPFHNRARALLGIGAALSGQVEYAQRQFAIGAALSPEDPVAQMGLAMVAAFRGDEAAALDAVRRATTRQPEFHDVLREIVSILADVNHFLREFELGDLDAANRFVAELLARATPLSAQLRTFRGGGLTDATASAVFKFPPAIGKTWGVVANISIQQLAFGTFEPDGVAQLEHATANNPEGLMTFAAGKTLLVRGGPEHREAAIRLLWKASEAPSLLPIGDHALLAVVTARVDDCVSEQTSRIDEAERARLRDAIMHLFSTGRCAPNVSVLLAYVATALGDSDLAHWIAAETLRRDDLDATSRAALENSLKR